MEINWNYIGEIDWKAILPMVTGIVAIAIHFHKLAKDKKNEEIKKEAEIKKNLLYFQMLVRKCIEKLSVQLPGFNNFASKLDGNQFSYPTFQITSLEILERVSTDKNQKDYFIAYLRTFGDNDNNQYNFTEIIDTIDEFHMVIKLFKKAYSDNLTSFTNTYTKYRDTSDTIISELIKLNSLENIEVNKEILLIFKPWLANYHEQNPTGEIEIAHKKVMKELIPQLAEYINKSEVISKIINDSRRLQEHHNTMVNNSKNLSKETKKVLTYLEVKLNYLKTNSKTLTNWKG